MLYLVSLHSVIKKEIILSFVTTLRMNASPLLPTVCYSTFIQSSNFDFLIR